MAVGEGLAKLLLFGEHSAVYGYPAVGAALMGARRPSQVAENAQAADWELLPEDLDAIDRIGRNVTDELPAHDTLWGPLWY